MSGKILVPLDGSREAERILDPLFPIARQAHAELVLLVVRTV